jgi:hypothetical protein
MSTRTEVFLYLLQGIEVLLFSYSTEDRRAAGLRL